MSEIQKSINFPIIFVCGATKGVGVSTISLGISVALRRKNLNISTSKFGNSLFEPTHFRRVLGRLSSSIDTAILSDSQIREIFLRQSYGSDILIIEGEGGFFDKLQFNNNFSTQAEFVAKYHIPTVLVVDATNYQQGIAAVIHGFINYSQPSRILGVIANKVSSTEHANIIESAVKSMADVNYLGGIRVGDKHQLGGTIAGFSLANPSALSRNKVIGNAKLVENSLDLEVFKQIAENAGEIAVPDIDKVRSKKTRIAIADDQVFHLVVQDNYDYLRRSGAELVTFSPIADKQLPRDISAIYFPSGYPHLYASDLSNNREMMKAIKDFVSSGGKVYAEGGAVAYFAKTFRVNDKSNFEMLGLLPGIASTTLIDNERSKYLPHQVEFKADCILGPRGTMVSGFRDTRFGLRFETPVKNLFEVKDLSQSGDLKVPEGFSSRSNVLATRLCLNWSTCPKIAEWFIDNSLIN